MNQTIASLSIAARVTLNMHSLNNEGVEGNQIQTRMVEFVDHNGKLQTVNAISGDMLKHVLMEHFYHNARDHKVALCEGCQRFNANRINADDKFLGKASKKDWEFIEQMLQTCAMDDVAGILVTKGRSTPRKSVSEFGWVLGMPDRVQTDTYLHVKYVPEKGDVKLAEDAAAQKTGANLGPNIFHRPASSGIYAIVCHLELSRIGYNDIIQRYAVPNDERQVRTSLLLESLLHTFIELNGAMRSTQLPHLVALEGVITTSTGVIPAPLISPLVGGPDDHDTYRDQIAEVVTALNGNQEAVVRADNFDSISGFATQMRSIIDLSSPFETNVAH